MDLDLRQLRALIAVVDEGTFTDAAIALGTSQASVSRAVVALEAALGVRVLRRNTRTVSPTVAGAKQHPESELVFVQSWSRAAGLTDGAADIAVVRQVPTAPRIGSAVVGHEARVAALAKGDLLARRRRRPRRSCDSCTTTRRPRCLSCSDWCGPPLRAPRDVGSVLLSPTCWGMTAPRVREGWLPSPRARPGRRAPGDVWSRRRAAPAW